ncbi:M23 family metallopeptidase [Demequina phytophila]|uniref:M23 family metallopeptidase n=1 Tax=Demequina phytophila TaxID=1638981 RepID=UPI0014703CDB|nr:M23 family metallopeptidase [Demequina phytophila]
MTRYLRGAATLAAACALMGAAGAAGALPVLVSPVEPMRADALFVAPRAPWAAGHRGIDLRAATGQPVLSPGDGVIAFSGPVVDRGVVTVDHGGGVVTSLEPVEHSPPAGTEVRSGEAIAVVGEDAGHCAPVTCVHWGVRVNGEYRDPLDLLAGFGPVVLLPLPDGDG